MCLRPTIPQAQVQILFFQEALSDTVTSTSLLPVAQRDHAVTVHTHNRAFNFSCLSFTDRKQHAGLTQSLHIQSLPALLFHGGPRGTHTASIPSLYLAFHLPKFRTEADRAYSEERLTQPLCFSFLLFKAPPQEATHPSSSYELCEQVV